MHLKKLPRLINRKSLTTVKPSDNFQICKIFLHFRINVIPVFIGKFRAAPSCKIMNFHDT